ncbi:sensor histidine kinase [Flavobacterium sp. J27]|uniref:sensor histidine kinase n=1 Tax=Flavobacterium sp. J27 TaxID=2060419 RepID=UPI00103236E9|nr:histidine kinase [Flavobacterium sp. J27]
MDREEIQLLVISLSIVFFTLLVILFVLFFFFQKKKTQFLIDKMESEIHFQSELIKTRVEIKDQTLTEISKELHDNIGQIISVAIMQLNMYAQKEETVSKAELLEVKTVMAKSLDEIRILSRIINKDNLINTNFIESIENDFKRIEKLKNIDCKLNINCEFPKINIEHELILYRIFQESIHNSLKHSSSKKIEMNINCNEDLLTINLKDFGIGFDSNQNHKGLGLNNIKFRAKLIGANLTLNSNENGTEIFLQYNLNKQNEDKEKSNNN